MYLKFNSQAFDMDSILTLGRYRSGQIRIILNKHSGDRKHVFSDVRTIEEIYEEMFRHTDFFMHKGIIYNPHMIGQFSYHKDTASLDVASCTNTESRFSYSGYSHYGEPHEAEDFDSVLKKLNAYRPFAKMGNYAIDCENIIMAARTSDATLRMYVVTPQGHEKMESVTALDLDEIKSLTDKFMPCFIHNGVFYNPNNISKIEALSHDDAIGIYGINNQDTPVALPGFNGFGEQMPVDELDTLIDLFNREKYAAYSTPKARGQNHAITL